MRSRILLLFVVSLAVSGCLRVDATDAGLHFGYAVAPQPLATDAAYRNAVALDANTLTAENHLKFGFTHPEPDRYDFTRGDEIVGFAEANGQEVRGHVLLWHRALPAWVTDRDWTRDELIAVLEDHIATVVGHFRDEFPGVVTQWDVVNEAFYADGTRRPTIWQEVIGDDYLEIAFRAAHAADPTVDLFYNDFYDQVILAAESAIDGTPPGPGASPTRTECDDVPKCAATRAMAADFVARGVPIDGIGLQAHLLTPSATDYERFASWTEPLGLEWAITELDVALPAGRGDDPALRAVQAATYAAVVEDCLVSPNCDTVIIWGVNDANSWIPSTSGGALDHALIRDDDNRPKPAYRAIHTLLGERGP